MKIYEDVTPKQKGKIVNVNKPQILKPNIEKPKEVNIIVKEKVNNPLNGLINKWGRKDLSTIEKEAEIYKENLELEQRKDVIKFELKE